MEFNWESLRKKLEGHYTWPALYTFKFIVPHQTLAAVKMLFPKQKTTERQSKDGNYTSVTVQMMMPSSQAVIEVYKMVSKIEGIIAL